RFAIVVCLGVLLVVAGEYRAGDPDKGPAQKVDKEKKEGPAKGPPKPGGGGGPPGGGVPGGPVGPPLGGGPGQAFPNAPKQKALPKDLVPALIEALKDEEKDVRQYAASALVRVGTDAVEPLIDLLKGKDKEQRANAAYVLGQMGAAAQEALPQLL